MKRTSIICTLTIITMLLTGCAANSMPQTEQPTAPNGTLTPDASAATDSNMTPEASVSTESSEASVSPTTPAPSEATTISEEDAKQIALDKVPGATTEHIRKFESDYDDGRPVYDGEIHFEQYEYDFEIDAQNGNILEWEAEPINDGIL